jgi:hypothetical protein
MNEIKIQNKTYYTPASWNELTFKQLSLISFLFGEKLKIVDFKIIALFKFLNIKKSVFAKITDTDMTFLTNTLDFLVNNVVLTKNLLPKMKLGIVKYLYGPADKLKNVSFIEFAKADTNYLLYLNTKDEKYLNKLIAVLYRQRHWFVNIMKFLNIFNGDVRQKYNDYFIIKNEPAIAKLKLNDRIAIMLFYQGCRNYIINKFPRVFKSGGSEDKESFGWAQLILELAGTKFGNDEQTANTLLHTILMHLEISAIQNEKMKQEMEKIRKR